MKRAVPSQHAAAAAGSRRGGGAHGTGHQQQQQRYYCYSPLLVVLFLLLSPLCCCGCEDGKVAVRTLLQTGDDYNAGDKALSAGNVCVKSLLRETDVEYYPLDTSKCFQDSSLGLSFLQVEARIFQQCADNHQWSVFVNTQGENVPVTNITSTISDDNTFVQLLGGESYGFNGHLDIPLSAEVGPQNWTIGFYSSCGPVQFTIKAWCSATKGCNLSCSDPQSGPCVSLEKCRCDVETADGCHIEVESLPDEEDIVTRYGVSHIGDVLPHGTWRYFRFQAYQNDSRTLVELDRSLGDLALFVKEEDSSEKGDVEALPVEQDVKYADLPSFKNRLSNHARFVNGSGSFIIGVYNADHCLQEVSTFNVTVTTVVPSDGISLCPKNCSFPQGKCVMDNVCSCEAGFGGQYCAGSVLVAAPRKVYSGQLQPGEWAYINMSAQQELQEQTDDIDVVVSFRSSTGSAILLAQQNGFVPTLTNFHLKFSNSSLGSTPNDTYRISGTSVILGVFNVDYMSDGISEFELLIIGTRRELAIWIIILMAIGSSIFLLSAALIVRQMIQRRGHSGLSGGRMTMDFEATPQDLELVPRHHQETLMISTLPLLAYQKGLLPKEDAGCSICLNAYDVGEIVCRLPGCKHVFHVRCLEEWFRKDGSCPLCRVPLHEQGVESSPDLPVHPSSSLLSSPSRT